MRKILKNRKALSPVVAAIILIAVTVAVSIAVAAWMGALTFTFMKTEELRITSHEWVDTPESVVLYFTNTGTAKLTLDYAEVNSVKQAVGDVTWVPDPPTIEPGASGSVTIVGSFGAGVKYEFAIVTATGGRYLTMATAPS